MGGRHQGWRDYFSPLFCSGCFWGGWPQPPQPCCPLPSSNKPRGFWVLSGGPQSTAVPVGDGESREEHEKEIGRWQAGHTERGPSRGQGTSLLSLDLRLMSLRICLALGQAAARQPLGI